MILDWLSDAAVAKCMDFVEQLTPDGASATNACLLPESLEVYRAASGAASQREHQLGRELTVFKPLKSRDRCEAARGRSVLFALLASSSLLSAEAVSAQVASSAVDVNQVEDVIVTARRRSETLQRVPVAVSVVSGETMRVQNRNSVTEMITLIPAIGLRPSGTKDTGLLIRGLGTITTSPGAEPTVSMVLDGVVLARPGQMVAELIDLDRIEVLRGPQGTLFGKNASAGVINVMTASPSPDPSGYIEASYFGGNEYRLTGVANGELIPGLLSGRIAGVTSGYDGAVRNIVTNAERGTRDSQGVRGKLLFTPSNDLTVLLAADYLYTEGSGQGVVYIGTANVAYPTGVRTESANLKNTLAAEGINPTFRNREVSSEIDPVSKDMFTGASSQIDYAMGEYALTSITGWRNWRSTQHVDGDGFARLTTTSPNQIVDLGHVDSTQFTQEVRLASPKGYIDYVVGVYFFHSVNKEDYRRDVTQLTGGRIVSNFGFNKYGTTSDNYSVFGEANINLADNLRLIAGARLVRDELKFYANRFSTSAVPVPGVQPAYAGKASKNVTDYASRLGVQYDLSDDIHGYLTYSRGYKGPAFNTFFNMLDRDAIALNPETSDDFELGIKTSLFDRRLRLNVALFNDQVSNYQANQPDVVAGSIVTRLINAGDVSAKGVEIEAVAKVTQNFTVNVDYAYVEAKIDKFKCPPGAAVTCDVNGKPLPYAPKHKVSIRADYEAYASPRYRVNINGNYTYQTEQQNAINQTPLTIAPAYGLLNGSISLTDSEYGWQGRILVRNILNKFYRSSYSQANGGVFAGVPRDYKRYYGITLRKDF